MFPSPGSYLVVRSQACAGRANLPAMLADLAPLGRGDGGRRFPVLYRTATEYLLVQALLSIYRLLNRAALGSPGQSPWHLN